MLEKLEQKIINDSKESERGLVAEAWEWKKNINQKSLNTIMSYFDRLQDEIVSIKRSNDFSHSVKDYKQLCSFAGEFAEIIARDFERKGDKKNIIIWYKKAQYFRREADRPQDIAYSADDCKRLLKITEDVYWGKEAFNRYVIAANRFANYNDKKNQAELPNLFYAVNSCYLTYKIAKKQGKSLVELVDSGLELSDRFFLLERILDESVFTKKKRSMIYGNLSELAYFCSKEFEEEGEINLSIQYIERELRYLRKAYKFADSNKEKLKFLDRIIAGETALYHKLKDIKYIKDIFEDSIKRLVILKSSNYEGIDVGSVKRCYKRIMSSGIKLTREQKDIGYIDRIIDLLPWYIEFAKRNDKAYGFFLLTLCGERGFELSDNIDKKNKYLKIVIQNGYRCGKIYEELKENNKALKAYNQVLSYILDYYEINEIVESDIIKKIEDDVIIKKIKDDVNERLEKLIR